MKTSFVSSFGNGFRKASFVAFALFTSGILAAAAPNVVNDPGKDSQTVTSPAPMRAVVFRMEETMKFKAIVENPSGKELRVVIKNAANNVLYEDRAGRMAKYIRKFDLSSLADGQYTVEISSGKEMHRQYISVGTVTARVASVQ